MVEAVRLGAFVVLVAVFLLRGRSAKNRPETRLSWYASGVGALAMFVSGAVFPSNWIDAALGGVNMSNLLQNILTTVAFWLLVQAVLTQNGQTKSLRELRWWPPLAIIVVFSIPFMLITGRGTAPSGFITSHAEDVWLWLYASIYMAAIAGLSAIILIRQNRDVPRRPFRLFTVGASLVIVGSLAEIAALTIDLFTPVHPSFLYALFDPFFFPGVILIVLGIGAFSIYLRQQHAQLAEYLEDLREILKTRGAAVALDVAEPMTREDANSATYSLYIEINDAVNIGTLTLTKAEERLIRQMDDIYASRGMVKGLFEGGKRVAVFAPDWTQR
ncbi:hypothetical protein HQQ81_20970 [Microbacteriaceae bacterium VKM Ac-2854]|nr:hypothetical protein [Microbacteriaceae bacterium VKM Ac-2854]